MEPPAFKTPAPPGQYMNLRRQTLNLYDLSIFCWFIFAQHLAHEFSIMERSTYSHKNMTAQARAPRLLLVPQLVSMVLTHRFVDIDSDWHYRPPGNLPTPFGNIEALLILHKHIQGETQMYKDTELQGHKQEVVAEHHGPQSKEPQSGNLGISA